MYMELTHSKLKCPCSLFGLFMGFVVSKKNIEYDQKCSLMKVVFKWLDVSILLQ